MSHKIDANAMRLMLSKDWKSKWFALGQQYTDQLREDLAVVKLVEDSLSHAGLDDVLIRRSERKVEVDAVVAKPGVAIGRGGQGIEQLEKKVKRIFKSVPDVQFKVVEVKKPDLSASIIAGEIAGGLQRRMPPKLLALSYIQKAIQAGAKGVRIWVSGRINGAQQARVIKHSQGPVPLHTLRADIDFCARDANTVNLGKFGIKVWVYKSEDNK